MAATQPFIKSMAESESEVRRIALTFFIIFAVLAVDVPIPDPELDLETQRPYHRSMREERGSGER